MRTGRELPQGLRVHAQPRLDPLPAFIAQGAGQRFQLLGRQPLQQRWIRQEAALLIVEQVAPHEATGSLVNLDAHEAHQRAACGFDLADGQPAPQRGRRLVPRLSVEPGALLHRMVVAQRQRHQLVQVDAVLAVQRQQLRRQRRQFQPALHRQHRHTEPRRHVLDALAFVDQRLEGFELVGRVHGLAPAVLGQADLPRTLGRHQLAQDLVPLGQPPALLQQQQRTPPTFAGRHGKLHFARLAPADHLLGDHQVVQQALRIDQRGQFLDLSDRVTPNVERRRRKRRKPDREQFLRVFHDLNSFG